MSNGFAVMSCNRVDKCRVTKMSKFITTVIFFFEYGKKCFVWDKTCQKKSMATFLRHLKQAL